MLRSLLLAILCFHTALTACAADYAQVPLANGFSLPVGLDGKKKYFKARGYTPNGHLGEDWNGEGGGDTDLGDPIYSTATGIVQYAKNFGAGWGNVVIVRHAYYEGGKINYVDSLYGHCDRVFVREGQLVRRAQLIATIGNNAGMYDAHLHFEIRHNINVGLFRSYYPRDGRVYYSPTPFIQARHTLSAGRTVPVPINTYRPPGDGEGTKPEPTTEPRYRTIFGDTAPHTVPPIADHPTHKQKPPPRPASNEPSSLYIPPQRRIWSLEDYGGGVKK